MPCCQGTNVVNFHLATEARPARYAFDEDGGQSVRWHSEIVLNSNAILDKLCCKMRHLATQLAVRHLCGK